MKIRIDLFLCRAPLATISYHQLKRSVYRARNTNLPQNAQDVPSIIEAYSRPNTMSKFGNTASGNSFYKTAYSCEAFSYCIFASDDIIKMFEEGIPIERRIFLMDANLKIRPIGIFNQMLIIYVSYLDTVSDLESFTRIELVLDTHYIYTHGQKNGIGVCKFTFLAIAMGK